MRRFPIAATSAAILTAVVQLSSLVTAASVAAQQRQAYRINKLALRDPGVFIGFGAACFELTNPPGLFGISVNDLINDYVTECNPTNATPCTYDFNLVAVFDPLSQTPGQGGVLAPCTVGDESCTAGVYLYPECTKTATGTVCSGVPDTGVETTYGNAGSGQNCLGPFPGTTGRNNVTAYTPEIPQPTGPCFQTGAVDFTFEFGSDVVVTIPLEGLQVAGTWVGEPATGIVKGLARGFLPESAADATVISVTSPVTLSVRLSEALPGGADRCFGGERDGLPCTNPTGSECPGGECKISCAPAGSGSNHAQDDSDHNPPDNLNGTKGWWFYLEFEAEPVTVPDAETPTPTATATATPPPTDTPTPLPTATPTPRPICAGDCNGDFNVTIGEVQTTANIFLESQPLSACASADVDKDGSVMINEIVRAALGFNNGCP